MEEIQKELTLRQKRFCEIFVSSEFYGNGVQSYLVAYSDSGNGTLTYNAAKVNASKLLTNTNILAYINSLLDEAGLNDAFIDKQLLFIITQNQDYSAKISALKEYNKLKSRINEKITHEVNVTGLPRSTWANDKEESKV